MGRKYKRRNGGNLDMPKKSCKVLPLREKEIVLDKKKVPYAAVRMNLLSKNSKGKRHLCQFPCQYLAKIK